MSIRTRLGTGRESEGTPNPVGALVFTWRDDIVEHWRGRYQRKGSCSCQSKPPSARCPHCSKVLKVLAAHGGKTVACPNPACGGSFTLPVAAEASPTPGVDNVGVYEIADAPLPSSKAATAKVVDAAMKSSDIVDQLQRLHQLHLSGALDDEEFATAKKSLLKGSAKTKEPRAASGGDRGGNHACAAA